MLYLYFFLFIIIVVFNIINDRKKGHLKTISKYEINKRIDESHNYKIKIPFFKKEAKYNRKINSYVQLKNSEELIKFSFKGEEIQFILTDKYYNIIYKINNPTELNFCTHEIDNTYKLIENKKYFIFVRYNPIIEDNFKYSVIKYYDLKKAKIKENTINNDITILNENNLYTELEHNSLFIIKDMKEKNFYIQDFKYAEQYISMPSNDIAHKLVYTTQQNETLVIITTNKKKMGCENHIFEINTNENSFNWYPDCNKLFCSFIIDNEIDNNKFIIYERLINIDNKSHIIPFKLLVFNSTGFKSINTN